MDPVLNPYSPGAGSQPPELAGRDQARRQAQIQLQRIRIGRASKSTVLVGLRGVGKTVLLDTILRDAEASGFQAVRVEAPEDRSLPALLAPQLRLALLRLRQVEKAKEFAVRGLRALAGFAGKLKFKYQDIEVGLDYAPEAGLADNGELETDLTALLEQAGRAAKEAGTVVAMFADELQYVKADQLAALIAGLHRCSQLSLPVALVAAGLPQLRARMAAAKSYSERLFDYVEVGPLNPVDARSALVEPARREGVEFEEAVVRRIVERTQGYPYFLQEWGKYTWEAAAVSPITEPDFFQASTLAEAALDASFFRVRFDRVTPGERRYLRAMAELGPGPHRSGTIAENLDRRVEVLGPTRDALIRKGMIWSPAHGVTAFTVPLFDEYLKRTMPGEEWRTS